MFELRLAFIATAIATTTLLPSVATAELVSCNGCLVSQVRIYPRNVGVPFIFIVGQDGRYCHFANDDRAVTAQVLALNVSQRTASIVCEGTDVTSVPGGGTSYRLHAITNY